MAYQGNLIPRTCAAGSLNNANVSTPGVGPVNDTPPTEFIKTGARISMWGVTGTVIADDQDILTDDTDGASYYANLKVEMKATTPARVADDTE
jgi:hypothetical protein